MRIAPARRSFLLRAVPVLLLALAGCGVTATPDADGSGEPQVYTQVDARTELFVEFAPLVAGERSTFAAHFTRLSDGTPVEAGTVDVVLSGGDAPTERFRVAAPRAPGLFAPTALPRATGERRLAITLVADGLEAHHDLGPVVIHADRASARAAGPAPGVRAGEIGYLKEQQWQNGLVTEAVTAGPLRESVVAPAVLRPSGDGSAHVVAPAAGTLRADVRLPAPGEAVARGQVLAMLVPRLTGSDDVASLRVALDAARGEAALADDEAARAQRLFDREAVSRRRLDEALAARRLAAARLDAARQRLAPAGEDGAGIALVAPIDGVVAASPLARGAAVEAGDLVLQLVDPREVWIEAQVAEADASRLRTPDGLAFELPGEPAPIEVRPGENGRLVGVGGMLDPASRSVPVVFALAPPPPGLVLNQRVQARVFTGRTREAPSVPASAVIDDAGQRVVYVVRGGESFSRVPVRLGLRDGDRFEVLEGVAEGERVVTRGAMLLRLAAATPEAMGHGHAH